MNLGSELVLINLFVSGLDISLLNSLGSELGLDLVQHVVHDLELDWNGLNWSWLLYLYEANYLSLGWERHVGLPIRYFCCW